MSIDVSLSRSLAICAEASSDYGRFRPYMKGLEWLLHGLPWIVGPIVTAVFTNRAFQTICANVLFGRCIFICLAVSPPSNSLTVD